MSAPDHLPPAGLIAREGAGREAERGRCPLRPPAPPALLPEQTSGAPRPDSPLMLPSRLAPARGFSFSVPDTHPLLIRLCLGVSFPRVYSVNQGLGCSSVVQRLRSMHAHTRPRLATPAPPKEIQCEACGRISAASASPLGLQKFPAWEISRPLGTARAVRGTWVPWRPRWL